MSTVATFNLEVRYTSPGGVPLTESFAIPVPGVAQNCGNIDIADLTAGSTVIVVPFGTIAKATGGVIRNTNSLDIGIRINGSVANNFQLAPGGTLLISQLVDAAAGDLTAISIVTTAQQAGAGRVAYWIFGT